MYRVLLLGRLDRTAEELYKCLYRNYHVQFCTETNETMHNMMRITKPDMVMVNAAEKGEIPTSVFEFLNNFYLHLPVVVVGSREVCDTYGQYYNGDNIVPIYRPVTTTSILEQCAKILANGKYVDPNAKKEEVKLKHVLVVDDSAVTLRSVKALLDKKYRVSVATSGEMAIKSMQRCLPDMVLLDYEMPDCDGRQTLEMIRQDETMKDIPVMFLTGVADKQHIASVLALNPVGYMLKPPEKEKLLEAIEAVFSGDGNGFIGGI